MKITKQQLRQLINETFEDDSRKKSHDSHANIASMIDKSFFYLKRARETYQNGQLIGEVYDDLDISQSWIKKVMKELMG